jgi:hypothetical protein
MGPGAVAFFAAYHAAFSDRPEGAQNRESSFWTLRGFEDEIVGLYFSMDGRSLITLSANQILRIWRAALDAAISVRH